MSDNEARILLERIDACDDDNEAMRVIAEALQQARKEALPSVRERFGCLGCPMVNGVCPHCGNEEDNQ
jgi:hypothetical protein